MPRLIALTSMYGSFVFALVCAFAFDVWFGFFIFSCCAMLASAALSNQRPQGPTTVIDKAIAQQAQKDIAKWKNN